MVYITFPYKGKIFHIDRMLASQLNSLAYNIRSDWDFVLLVTGDRSVRVGKSVLAMQVAGYLAYLFDKMGLNQDAFNIDNIFFESQKIMDDAPYKSKHSVILYDEGREGLAAIKAMRGFQQDLVDFFTECGQLNHLFIIVMPDFFDLKEDMAVARSELLLNVYRSETAVTREIFKDGVKYPVVKYGRGFFQFYNKQRKKKLYDIARAKHIKSYALVKASLPPGQFPNEYTVDEIEYKKKKLDSLMRFKEKKKVKENSISKRYKKYYHTLMYYLKKEHKLCMADIARILGVDKATISLSFKTNIDEEFIKMYNDIQIEGGVGVKGKESRDNSNTSKEKGEI